jgi:hypothetical protein
LATGLAFYCKPDDKHVNASGKLPGVVKMILRVRKSGSVPKHINAIDNFDSFDTFSST